MTFFADENLWLYLPLVAWIGGIFYLASGRNSAGQTARVFLPLLKLLFPRDGLNKLQNYHVVIRKCGHLTGYATLAVLASIVFYNTSLLWAAKFWYVCAFAVVFIVASADELLQSRDAERIGSFRDVALDCIGGLAAIFLFWLFVAIRF